MNTKHSANQEKRFKTWQWRVIISTMIGYSIFYFVRKNFSFAIPVLTAEYGITKASFGIIMTLVGLIYGVSKLLNGMLADRCNARIHMCTGLAFCVFFNFLFGWGATISEFITGTDSGAPFVNAMVVTFAVLMILNNIFQGTGFPPCNRLMTHWVPPTELATKMSIWNVSHSLGGSLVAILCGAIVANMGTDFSGDPEWINRIAFNLFGASTEGAVQGAEFTATLSADQMARVSQYASHVGSWQWVFWIPAFIGLAGLIFLIFAIRDTPKSVGLPELEGTKTAIDNDDSSEAFKAFVKKMVWKNPIIWILAVSDFFVYIIRGIVFDWGPTFLQEAFSLDGMQAGFAISAFEIAGIVGMLVAGVISDRIFKGRSNKVCTLFMFGATFFVGVLCLLPSHTPAWILAATAAGIGFFLYGPQALVGVVAANQATKKAASTALGVIGFTSYLSSIISGSCVGLLLDGGVLSWKGVFIGMFIVGISGVLMLATLWKLKGDGYEH